MFHWTWHIHMFIVFGATVLCKVTTTVYTKCAHKLFYVYPKTVRFEFESSYVWWNIKFISCTKRAFIRCTHEMRRKWKSVSVSKRAMEFHAGNGNKSIEICWSSLHHSGLTETDKSISHWHQNLLCLKMTKSKKSSELSDMARKLTISFDGISIGSWKHIQCVYGYSQYVERRDGIHSLPFVSMCNNIGSLLIHHNT